jgi:hypothetical protein
VSLLSRSIFELFLATLIPRDSDSREENQVDLPNILDSVVRIQKGLTNSRFLLVFKNLAYEVESPMPIPPFC